METVGIRELKNRLSAYVRKVEAGDVVLVTDRGVVVAELVPPGTAQRPGIHPGLLELARRDGLRLPTRPRDPSAYPLMPSVDLGGRTVQDLLDEERGDR
jgi:prevent-host-death family protein